MRVGYDIHVCSNNSDLLSQVNLVLNLEDKFWLIPKFRHYVNTTQQELNIRPYKGYLRRWFSPLLRMLRGKDYRSAECISSVLNPTKVYRWNHINIYPAWLTNVKCNLAYYPLLHACRIVTMYSGFHAFMGEGKDGASSPTKTPELSHPKHNWMTTVIILGLVQEYRIRKKGECPTLYSAVQTRCG